MVTDRLENLKGIIQYLMADLNISHQIPHTLEERQRMMRALMNVWIPKPIDMAFLTAQDAELQMQRDEKGVVTPNVNGLQIWQGDITRLKVDAIVNAANAQALGCWSPLHKCIDNCIHSAAIGLLVATAQMHRQLHPLRRGHPTAQGVRRHHAGSSFGYGRCHHHAGL